MIRRGKIDRPSPQHPLRTDRPESLEFDFRKVKPPKTGKK